MKHVKTLLILICTLLLLAVVTSTAASGELFDLSKTKIKNRKYTVYARKYYWHGSKTIDYVLIFEYRKPKHPQWAMTEYYVSTKGKYAINAEILFAMGSAAVGGNPPTSWKIGHAEAKHIIYEVEFLCGWEKRK